MSKIVLFIFAGREENMRVQMPYLHDLLDRYPEMEVHLWDLTRSASDQLYLNTVEGGRIKVMRHLHSGHPIRCMYPGAQQRRRGYPPCQCMKHKPPYEQPYRWYAAQPEYDEATFVKVDDDVLFLETKRFDDLIAPLAEHPERVISANVVNNAVCAKYEPDLSRKLQLPGSEDALGDPADPEFDKDWWELHTSAEFGTYSHDWFLSGWVSLTDRGTAPAAYIKTRQGEAISINCIAFSSRTMRWLAESFKMNSRLGDEGAVDLLLPWIATTFRAAHLTFGPQEKALSSYELDYYRQQYDSLRKRYLGE